VIHDAALANWEGSAQFHHIVNDPGWSGLRAQERYFKEPEREIIQVRVIRLDGALKGVPRVDFIKIDVEGGEFGVLKGGQNTLERFKPTVYFEHARIHFLHYGEISIPVYDLLTGIGLSILSLKSAKLQTREQFVEAVEYSHRIDYERDAETNFLAAPQDRLLPLTAN
jgi:hypothetical protein